MNTQNLKKLYSEDKIGFVLLLSAMLTWITIELSTIYFALLTNAWHMIFLVNAVLTVWFVSKRFVSKNAI